MDKSRFSLFFVGASTDSPVHGFARVSSSRERLAAAVWSRTSSCPASRRTSSLLWRSLDEHPGQDELCDKFLGISLALPGDGGAMRRGVLNRARCIRAPRLDPRQNRFLGDGVASPLFPGPRGGLLQGVEDTVSASEG